MHASAKPQQQGTSQCIRLGQLRMRHLLSMEAVDADQTSFNARDVGEQVHCFLQLILEQVKLLY